LQVQGVENCGLLRQVQTRMEILFQQPSLIKSVTYTVQMNLSEASFTIIATAYFFIDGDVRDPLIEKVTSARENSYRSCGEEVEW
jgi:hypothetical protein